MIEGTQANHLLLVAQESLTWTDPEAKSLAVFRRMLAFSRRRSCRILSAWQVFWTRSKRRKGRAKTFSARPPFLLARRVDRRILFRSLTMSTRGKLPPQRPFVELHRKTHKTMVHPRGPLRRLSVTSSPLNQTTSLGHRMPTQEHLHQVYLHRHREIPPPRAPIAICPHRSTTTRREARPRQCEIMPFGTRSANGDRDVWPTALATMLLPHRTGQWTGRSRARIPPWNLDIKMCRIRTS